MLKKGLHFAALLIQYQIGNIAVLAENTRTASQARRFLDGKTLFLNAYPPFIHATALLFVILHNSPYIKLCIATKVLFRAKNGLDSLPIM